VPLKYSFELKYIFLYIFGRDGFNLFLKYYFSPHEISGMMINMSRHCDFMASTIKFIYSETSLENSDTIKVVIITY
jgi:hypothetical protein